MSTPNKLDDLCLRNKSALATFLMRHGIDEPLAEHYAANIIGIRKEVSSETVRQYIDKESERLLHMANDLAKQANEKRLTATTLGEIAAMIEVSA